MNAFLGTGIRILSIAVGFLFVIVLLQSPLLELYEHSRYHVPEIDEVAIAVFLALGLSFFCRRILVGLLRIALLKNIPPIALSLNSPRFRPKPAPKPPPSAFLTFCDLRI